MLSRIPLLPVVLLASSMALIAAVLVFIGAPMAGDGSAYVAAGVAVVLTVPMALAFSHREHGKSGH